MSSAVRSRSGESIGMFASFGFYNYKLYFAGSFVANVGSWMARVAQDWLVLTQLTNHSSAALGLVTGLQFAPVALLAPYAGAIADRFPKRRILMGTTMSLGATSLVLWLLVASGSVQLWHVYVLAVAQGAISALDNPTRQAFASEMVPTTYLPNAVGLNSASFNGARLLGPGISGLVIAAFGVAPALLINGVSFAAPIVALYLMRSHELTPAPLRKGRGAMREGLRYVRGRPDIMLVMFVVFMLGTFGMNFQITNALMATTVFHKGAGEYGLLGSIMAIGTLAAALIAARRARPRLRIMLGSLAGFTVFTALLAAAPSYLTYSVILVVVGLFALTVLTTANSSVQLACEPEMRGRVMALYMAIFMGGTPLGAPIIGWVGQVWGARWTLAAGAIATGLAFVVAAWFIITHDQLRVRLRFGWPPRVQVLRPQRPDVRAAA
ncbi:MAG: MFS transporter [Propionibacterium sp.]|nr:MFS transporter [Propionibacterium sp.]